jgi:amino acid adenylation domain-containing protein
LPIRISYTQKQSIDELLLSAHHNFFQVLQCDSLSLTDIAALSGIASEQLFQTLFVFGSHQFNRVPQRQAMGLTIDYAQLYNPTHYPLTVLVIADKQQLSLKVTHINRYVDQDLVSHLMKQYRHLLCSVTQLKPTQSIAQLSMYSVLDESATFIGHDISYREWAVQQFIDEKAAQYPDYVAVEDSSSQLTYAALTAKANQFAHYLLTLKKPLERDGHRQPLRVTICMDPSVTLMICVLGTLKAGGFYIPIDPTYPVARTQRILENSRSDLLIISPQLAQKIIPHLDPNAEMNIFEMPDNIERATKLLQGYSAQRPNVDVAIDDPCYCVYTSGSTGQPKGVLVPHRTIVNLIIWQNTDCAPSAAGKQKNIAMTSAFGFDQFENQTFYALMNGYRLFLVSASMRIDLPELLQCFIEQKINQTYIPTSMLSYFAEVALAKKLHLPDLCDLIVAGEGLFTNQMIKTFFEENPQCCLKNYYGPSEAHVVSAYTVPAGADWSVQPARVPIGQAIANTTLKIVDQMGKTVGRNMTGELLIAGDCLGLGYLDAPHLTNQRFVLEADGKRYYKTGDLVKLENGELVYLGRIDNQLKIRGCRVEPGEIENVLATHPDISQAVVLPKTDKHGKLISLLAFYISTETRTDEQALRQFLLQHLPKYMLPQVFIKMNTFSLTGNGKKDRDALLLEYEKWLLQPQNNNTMATTKTLTQQTLTEIWLDLLNGIRSQHSLSLEDDFFAVGGHSILAIRLLMCINEKMHVHITMRELLVNSTIAGLAMLIDQKQVFLDSIVPLNIKHQQAIFLIHPIGGTIYWYTKLASYVKSPVIIYGISDPGIEKDPIKNYRFESITEMATHYIGLIKYRKPRGPYVLGGASSGGVIALEIARILRAQGEEITAVLLFDSWAIHPPLIYNELEFKTVMKQQMVQQCSDLKYFDMDFWLNLQWSRVQLLGQHTIEPHINYRVVLFRAREHYAAFKIASEPNNYWQQYFAQSPQQLMKIDVPGDHETMFEQPNIQQLAQRLDEVITQKYQPVGNMEQSKQIAIDEITKTLETWKALGISAVAIEEFLSKAVSNLHSNSSLPLVKNMMMG